jgi:hypothetical protein
MGVNQLEMTSRQAFICVIGILLQALVLLYCYADEWYSLHSQKPEISSVYLGYTCIAVCILIFITCLVFTNYSRITSFKYNLISFDTAYLGVYLLLCRSCADDAVQNPYSFSMTVAYLVFPVVLSVVIAFETNSALNPS